MPTTNIKITATDKSKAAFASARKSTQALQGGILAMKGALVGFLSIAGARMFTAWVGTLMDAADVIGKMSMRLDISTKALQEFRYAGELSGESIESMDNNIVKFVRNVGDAHNGVTTIVDEFERLGINLKARNGEWKSHEVLIKEVADAYKNTDSPMRKLSSAMTLFGRGGRVMVNMLSEGREGLERHGRILRKVSGIIRRDFVEASEEANDAMTLWGKIWDASTSRVMEGMVRGFLNVSDAMLEMKGLDPIKIMALPRLRKEYYLLDEEISELANTLKEGGEWYNKIGIGSLKATERQIQDSLRVQNAIKAQINRLTQLSEKKEQVKKVTSSALKDEKKGYEITTEMQKLHTSQIDAGFKKYKQAQEGIRKEALKTTQATLKEIEKRKAASVVMIEMRKSMGDVEMQQIEELYDKRKVAIEDAYGNEIRWAELAKIKKTKAEEDFNRSVTLLHTERLASVADTAKNTADILYRQGLVGFDVMRAMAYTQAMINAHLAATKALASLPPPYSYIAAGLAYTYAAGRAYEISHMEPPKREHGGTVTAGRTYMVGERGVEMFTPNQTGSITPNDQMGGKNVTFNILANDTRGFDQLLQQRRGMIVSMLNNHMSSNGLPSIETVGRMATSYAQR